MENKKRLDGKELEQDRFQSDRPLAERASDEQDQVHDRNTPAPS